LVRLLSAADAERFAWAAMARLPNRYPWTYTPGGASLDAVLRREARIVRRAWTRLLREARRGPLLAILNATTPTDYLTAALPGGAVLWHPKQPPAKTPVLVLTGLKIASSEHREPLDGSPEGDGLTVAVAAATALNRRPVFVDFSRRRFPRSFLRAARFAERRGWGLDPWDKVREDRVRQLPGPKSVRGIPPRPGRPVLSLFDPWPLCDPAMMGHRLPEDAAPHCDPNFQKPWQDDRVGARIELEADALGIYRPVSRPWIMPTPGGWTGLDVLFRRRLARHLREAEP